jgi:hypothetical protein
MTTRTIGPKDPAESEVVTFDFTNKMRGETISGVVSVTIAVESGNDPSPSNMLNGAPAVSGFKVMQAIAGGIDGTNYYMRCQIQTSGNRTPVCGGVLAVRRDGR